MDRAALSRRGVLSAVCLVMATASCSTAERQPVESTSPSAPSATSASPEPPVFTQAPVYAALPFTVVESAFTTSDGFQGSSYVHWAAVLNNPNAGHYGSYPVMTVTARDAAGAVVGMTQQTLSGFPPGARIGWAGLLEVSAVPASVEVTPATVQWTPTTATSTEFPSITADSAQIGGASFSRSVTGELINPYASPVNDVAVTALFRDGAGSLIGGTTGFVQGLPSGGRLPFSISVMSGEAPAQPTTVEVSAIPWGGLAEEWFELSQAGLAEGLGTL